MTAGAAARRASVVVAVMCAFGGPALAQAPTPTPTARVTPSPTRRPTLRPTLRVTPRPTVRATPTPSPSPTPVPTLPPTPIIKTKIVRRSGHGGLWFLGGLIIGGLVGRASWEWQRRLRRARGYSR